MRQVVSLSLAPADVKKLKRRVKERGLASSSAYVKQLLDEDENLISADELESIIKEGDAEYDRGETVSAKSVLDLL